MPGTRRSTIRLVILLAVVAGLTALTLADRWLYHTLAVAKAHLPGIERKDWYRLLRIVGYLPTWLAVAAAFAFAGLRHRSRDDGRRSIDAGGGTPNHLLAIAWRLAAAPAIAGLAAEAVKRLAGRLRPDQTDGLYQYKALAEGFTDPSNLGMPSSHAAVAFGGAFMLARLVPGTWPVAIALGAGCGYTRLLSGAHFATDVYVAALIGWSAAWLVRPRTAASEAA